VSRQRAYISGMMDRSYAKVCPSCQPREQAACILVRIQDYIDGQPEQLAFRPYP
jgi:hypothetical protein